MLFDFALLPIVEIRPWGQPGDLSLHWFGLTDGCYWIEAGEHTLFEYSKEVRAAGIGRYCEYQVVRLYEDLLEMLPHILEPVPESLTQYVSGDPAIEWRAVLDAWCDRTSDQLDTDRFNQLIDAVTMWSGARRLNSAHLSPSANISLWSDTENVFLEWDNRDRFFDGKLAWSALRGAYEISRGEFIAEVRSFDKRLMEQMSERIDEVASGALSPDIHVDVPGLVREHGQRRRGLDEVLKCQPQTDWDDIAAAIDEIRRS